VPAILAPTLTQVNAQDYSGNFRRRRREWKRGWERRGLRLYSTLRKTSQPSF
jgi:hypothetical protein